MGEFFSGAGGGIISGAMGLIGGLITGKKNRDFQAKQAEEQREFAEKMAQQQNEWELDRMALQNDYNKQAANYNQQLAKDMWNYTGYGNQKKQMEDAGLNPALMYGQGGGGGQSTDGGAQEGVTAINPMGLQVGLQAQQTLAQTDLLRAQTKNIEADTIQKNSIEMAKGIMEISGKWLNNIKTANDIKKQAPEIEAAYMDLAKKAQEIRQLGLQNEFDEKTMQVRIDSVSAEYSNLNAKAQLIFGQHQLLQKEYDNFERKMQILEFEANTGRMNAETAQREAQTHFEALQAEIMKNEQQFEKWEHDIITAYLNAGANVLSIFSGGLNKFIGNFLKKVFSKSK